MIGGLLVTLVLIFAFQAQNISRRWFVEHPAPRRREGRLDEPPAGWLRWHA
jgi:hypothetical protein